MHYKRIRLSAKEVLTSHVVNPLSVNAMIEELNFLFLM